MGQITVDTEPDDDELLAEWIYEADSEWEEVVVSKLADDDEWPWQVAVAAAEAIREEPLESEFRGAIDAAIRRVAGVTDVVEEDREVWLVAGDPDGADLTEAVAVAVEPFAERLEAELGEDSVAPVDADDDEDE